MTDLKALNKAYGLEWVNDLTLADLPCIMSPDHECAILVKIPAKIYKGNISNDYYRKLKTKEVNSVVYNVTRDERYKKFKRMINSQGNDVGITVKIGNVFINLIILKEIMNKLEIEEVTVFFITNSNSPALFMFEIDNKEYFLVISPFVEPEEYFANIKFVKRRRLLDI